MLKLLVAMSISITSAFGLAKEDKGGATSNQAKYSQEITLADIPANDFEHDFDVAIYLYKAGQDAHIREIFSEIDGKKVPTLAWMLKIAKCETGINWRNGGNYAGAFGIYIGTWKQWGGLEFAPSADEALPEEQIVVWLRVHVLGYQPIFKSFVPSAGWNINTCWHGAGDVQWTTYELPK